MFFWPRLLRVVTKFKCRAVPSLLFISQQKLSSAFPFLIFCEGFFLKLNQLKFSFLSSELQRKPHEDKKHLKKSQINTKIAPRHELLLLKKPQKPQNFKLRAPEYGWETFFATQNTEKMFFLL